MASVFALLEAFTRKEAAALGFFPCATASVFFGYEQSRKISENFRIVRGFLAQSVVG